jgi:hypothetical protein
VLYALSVRMNESGEAFPSQRLLAADTALGERTVRDAIQEARRASWLAVVSHRANGQGWRRSHYIACVPDHLKLETVHLGRGVDVDRMSQQSSGEHAEVADRMHDIPRPQRQRGARSRGLKGAATIAAAPIEANQGRAATEHNDVRQLAAGGAADGSENVRQPSPTKFPYDVPIQVPIREGRALTRRDVFKKESFSKKEDRPTDLPQRIRKLTAAGNQPADIIKILSRYDVTLDDVQDATRHGGLGPE